MDSKRVLAWLKDPKRKQAHLAFTEGDERQAAYLIEEAERALRKEIESLKTRNKELVEALMNMTGLFDVPSTRLVMGTAFTDLHKEAVKSARTALEHQTKEQACKHEWVKPFKLNHGPGSVCLKCETPWLPGEVLPAGESIHDIP